jgi:DNA polymerase-3 subunit alpha
MGKKKRAEMEGERERFRDGAVGHGIKAERALAIFDQMEKFAAYGFNKSHSAAYALISFQTAYLKADYPEEFMAGLLSLEMGETDSTYKNIAECRARGIPILPPDINESGEKFTVTDKGIRFGLGAVRGVGSKAIEIILAARREGGPFTDLADFANRVRGQQINRRVIECLIKCGAFDSLGTARESLLSASETGAPSYLDRVLQWASTAAESAGQITLFALASVAPPRPPGDMPVWSDKQRLAAEKETVGFYITGHPLDKFERDLKRLTTAPIAALGARTNQEKVKVGGVVHTLRLKNNKRGDRYATFNLEDKSGTIEVIVWPEAYRKYEPLIASDQPLCVGGTLEVSEERCQIIGAEIEALAAVREHSVREIRIRLGEAALTAERAQRLAEMLRAHPGSCPASIEVLADAYVASVRLPRFRVAASEQLVDAVERLFGGRVAYLQ